MATVAELDEAVGAARDNGCGNLMLLKCTSSYPAAPDSSNLRTIPHMRELFGVQVGLSDHTPGIGVAVAGVALGATLIEKHFTLCRTDGGVDAAFSLEPEELKHLVEETRRSWQSLGEVHYGRARDEETSLRFRRSLYVVEDMRAGEAFTDKNLRAIRPGFGLAPKHYDHVLGRTVKVDTKRGTAVTWDLLA
jgi:N-acetylneuraminate synthase